MRSSEDAVDLTLPPAASLASCVLGSFFVNPKKLETGLRTNSAGRVLGLWARFRVLGLWGF